MKNTDILKSEMILTKALDHIFQEEDIFGTVDIMKSWGMTPIEIQDTWERYIDDDAPFRICSVCGEIMFDGYYDGDNTDKYYCSDECLQTDYTLQEWADNYTEDGDSYWTQWY